MAAYHEAELPSWASLQCGVMGQKKLFYGSESICRAFIGM